MGRVYKPRGGRQWYVDYRDGRGKRVRKAVSRDRRAAGRILRELETAADLERAGVGAARKPVSWAWAAGEFDDQLDVDGRADRTKELVQETLEAFAQDMNVTRLDQVTESHLEAWKAALVMRGRASGTVNGHLRRLKRFLRWCAETGRAIRDAGRSLHYVRARPRRRRRALEEDEIEALLEASPEIYRRIWRAFLLTGLRSRELRELRWADVGFCREMLIVRASKGRDDVKLPMAGELFDLLWELKEERPDCDSQDHVFLNAAGRPWRHNLLRRFRTCLARAGVRGEAAEGLDLHSLRVTAGTRWASAGVEPAILKTLMRHRDINTTHRYYVKPRVVDLRRAVERGTTGGAPEGGVGAPGAQRAAAKRRQNGPRAVASAG